MQQTSGFGSRIADALRVAAFIKVPEERMRASWVEIMAAAFLALCVPTAYAFIASGGEGMFASRGVQSALLFVPVFFNTNVHTGTSQDMTCIRKHCLNTFYYVKPFTVRLFIKMI